MAGEIIKGTVNVASVNGRTSQIVPDPLNESYFNQIAAYDYDAGFGSILSLQNGQTAIDNTTPKLAVEQGKKFQTRQITFDSNVLSANVEAMINDRIDQWIASTNSARYDDFQVIINTSVGGTHDITVIIVRYF